MPDQDDQVLFEKVKKDDLKAFETLFRTYYAQLIRYGMSMVRDESVAEEISQEIFMYLWEKRKEIQLKSALKSYLFTSVRYKSINYIKLELPKLQATTDLEGISGISEPPMTTSETDLLKARVQHAIDQLPDKCRNIFVLSRYGGLTYKEIADELDLSVKTVENQMTIALKKLREMLSSDLKEFNLK